MLYSERFFLRKVAESLKEGEKGGKKIKGMLYIKNYRAKVQVVVSVWEYNRYEQTREEKGRQLWY